MTGRTEALQNLLTAMIDSRHGYEEALADAEGKGLTPLFRDMIAMRKRDESRVSALLVTEGVEADQSGSFMTTVHRTVISIRAALTGLHENILPALESGEQWIVGAYDKAIAASHPSDNGYDELLKQRDSLNAKIEDMRRMELGVRAFPS